AALQDGRNAVDRLDSRPPARNAGRAKYVVDQIFVRICLELACFVHRRASPGKACQAQEEIVQKQELRRMLAAAGFATASAVAPLSASAAPIELALVLDASGSISSTNWTLQTQAYANALTGLLPTDGSVAV